MAVQIKCDTKEVSRKLKALKGQSETALQKVVSEFKRRAPGWIAKDITAVYNIKKKEAKGSMTPSGSGLDAVINIKGRVLTLAHFGLKPKSGSFKKTYIVSSEIFKGSRKTYSTKTSFVYNGTAFTTLDENGEKMKRVMNKNGKMRNPLRPLDTLSVTQMAENEEVAENIDKDIDKNLMKRAQHYLERYLGR